MSSEDRSGYLNLEIMPARTVLYIRRMATYFAPSTPEDMLIIDCTTRHTIV